MATMVKMLAKSDCMVTEVFDRQNAADQERAMENEASTRIQAWYRGQKVRSYLGHLNSCAENIQRVWRGHLGRRGYRIKVKNDVFIMRLNFYNEQAVKIQKVWKGYYTRKYISNYYSRKSYLEGLITKNELVRKELNDYKEQQDHIKKLEDEEKARKALHDHASKHHFLLSTKVVPGVYDSPFKPYPDEMEYILKNTRPRSHKKEKVTEEPLDPTCKKYGLPKTALLPPIPPKPQGPFREPADVQKQRYKSFQPTLRVETGFYSVDQARDAMKRSEWVGRVNDNVFVPFTKRHRQYEPYLHTTSSYGHLPYGTKYYREEHIDKHVTQQLSTVRLPTPQEESNPFPCNDVGSYSPSDMSHWSEMSLPTFSPTPSSVTLKPSYRQSQSWRNSTTPTPRDKCDSTGDFIKNKTYTPYDQETISLKLPSPEVFEECELKESSSDSLTKHFLLSETNEQRRRISFADDHISLVNILKDGIGESSGEGLRRPSTPFSKIVEFINPAKSQSEEDFINKCKTLLKLKRSSVEVDVDKAKPLTFKQEVPTKRLLRSDRSKNLGYSLKKAVSPSESPSYSNPYASSKPKSRIKPSSAISKMPRRTVEIKASEILSKMKRKRLQQEAIRQKRKLLSDAYLSFCDQSRSPDYLFPMKHFEEEVNSSIRLKKAINE